MYKVYGNNGYVLKKIIKDTKSAHDLINKVLKIMKIIMTIFFINYIIINVYWYGISLN